MGLFQRLSDAINGKSKVAVQETQGQIFVNSLCSNAENVFAQLRPLVDELKMVQPFGLGRNGAKLPISRTPELLVLQAPNEEMGQAEFADLMFTTWLTEKELNIHVWKNQRGKIYGYTILPPNSRFIVGGEVRFRTTRADGTIEELTRDEVMTLRFSRNPRDIDSGVSPGIAAMVWAQLDDVMAQYQLAHIENGAVPAHITIIRASTREKYLAKRKEMEEELHGSKNKGKTLFLWRQFLDNGQEKDEVEIKTIQGSNAELAISEIMSIVNDKLNKSFGVSNFILGDDSSAKYDNAELSQQQFLSHRVYPALFTFWSQFQHELERIKGGLSYSISWELEIPELTDRLKVKAETKKVEAETANLRLTKEKIEEEKKRVVEDKNRLVEETKRVQSTTKRQHLDTIITAIEAGSTPEAIVTALGLDDSWLELAQSIRGGSVSEIPNSTQTDSKEVESPSYTHDDKCGCCHHSQDGLEPKFSVEEVVEQQIYLELLKVIDSAVHEVLGEGFVLSQEDLRGLTQAIVGYLSNEADDGANMAAGTVQAIVLGATGDEISSVLKDGGYHLSDEFYERIEKRTEKLISRLGEEAKEKARQVLNNRGEPKSASEIERALSEVMPRARAATIARGETVYAFRAGHLENDRYITQKYGLKMKKVWRARKGACDICLAMNGKEVSLDEAFPNSVEGVDKDGNPVTYYWTRDDWNDGGQITSAHVNCTCYFETIVEGYND